jgi:rubrerythrin
MTEKGRERIINEIETVDQAVKAEKNVELGYHGVIDENIAYWLAVEEDLIESYTKLLKKTVPFQELKQTGAEEMKTTLTTLVKDSENHVRMLTSIKKSFTKIMNDEHRHARLLESLREEFHK